jgi:hypothetical protein
MKFRQLWSHCSQTTNSLRGCCAVCSALQEFKAHAHRSDFSSGDAISSGCVGGSGEIHDATKGLFTRKKNISAHSTTIGGVSTFGHKTQLKETHNLDVNSATKV